MTRLSVSTSLAVSLAQTTALIVAAVVTGSASLRTQSVTSLADVAGSVFLIIGVLSSARDPDDRHPLGYGRERFFWSFVAAIAVFIGGFGAAAVESVESGIHPRHVEAYSVGYSVLALVTLFDVIAFGISTRSLTTLAAERRVSPVALLWRGTDPANTTVVLTSAAGILSGVAAGGGLFVGRLTGKPIFDAVGSALIGIVLLITSVVLLHTNRELLTGRGLARVHIERFRAIIGSQYGVVAVPDVFAIVVGPATIIVDGDVVFDDALDVPAVEDVLVSAAAALRTYLPAIDYIYLNPVSAQRPRRRSSHRLTRPSADLASLAPSEGTYDPIANRVKRAPWTRPAIHEFGEE